MSVGPDIIRHTSSSSREEIVEAFDALEANLDHALGFSFDALTTPERLAMLDRCETVRRRLPAAEHPLINQVAVGVPPACGDRPMPPSWAASCAMRWPIGCGSAAARRRAASGKPPIWASGARRPVTAAAGGHRRRPTHRGHRGRPRGGDPRLCAPAARLRRHRDCRNAEAQPARLGGDYRPDELSKLADQLTHCPDPDGTFTDQDRARRRGITIGPQGLDGMSPITGYLAPEARATLEAVVAKLAAPGMCNPDEKTPCVEGAPSQHAIDSDTRSCAQRNHDALNAGYEMWHA